MNAPVTVASAVAAPVAEARRRKSSPVRKRRSRKASPMRKSKTVPKTPKRRSVRKSLKGCPQTKDSYEKAKGFC